MSDSHHKTCVTCGARKPIKEFHRKSQEPDGHRGDCRACISLKARKYREKNPETVATSKRLWVARNPEKAAEITRRYRDRGGIKNYTARLRETNIDAYARMTFKWAKRHADRIRATPKWFNAEKVKAIYLQAARMRRSGFDVHVDHIIPLRGGIVSGLHVHNNLRIIPAAENLSKGAKLLDGDDCA